MTQPRLRSRIVALFGSAALLLTLVGLWARVAHGVVLRTRELAIRQAVGARPVEVIMLAGRDAVLVVLAGVVLGLALLPASNAGARAVIPGLPSAGWPVVFMVVGGFVGLALASAYGPARRAGRIEPATVLRAE
jgi:ABC-type antimicrobial peptide transport system permease subunit